MTWAVLSATGRRVGLPLLATGSLVVSAFLFSLWVADRVLDGGAGWVFSLVASSLFLVLSFVSLGRWVWEVAASEAVQQFRLVPGCAWGYVSAPGPATSLRLLWALDRSSAEVRELYRTILADALEASRSLDPVDLLDLSRSLASGRRSS